MLSHDSDDGDDNGKLLLPNLSRATLSRERSGLSEIVSVSIDRLLRVLARLLFPGLLHGAVLHDPWESSP